MHVISTTVTPTASASGMSPGLGASAYNNLKRKETHHKRLLTASETHFGYLQHRQLRAKQQKLGNHTGKANAHF